MLKEFPDMTASQLYEWLEERRQTNLPFSERTMRLYIAGLRIHESCGHQRWVRTRIVHDGSDYFLWGYRGVPLSGLTVRERGKLL